MLISKDSLANLLLSDASIVHNFMAPNFNFDPPSDIGGSLPQSWVESTVFGGTLGAAMSAFLKNAGNAANVNYSFDLTAAGGQNKTYQFELAYLDDSDNLVRSVTFPGTWVTGGGAVTISGAWRLGSIPDNGSLRMTVTRQIAGDSAPLFFANIAFGFDEPSPVAMAVAREPEAVLRAIQGMTDEQDTAVKAALGIVGGGFELELIYDNTKGLPTESGGHATADLILGKTFDGYKAFLVL